MGLREASKDLEACRMSRRVLLDKEIATRVRAAVAGAFQAERVKCIPMMSEEGHLGLVGGSSHNVSSYILQVYQTTSLPFFHV